MIRTNTETDEPWLYFRKDELAVILALKPIKRAIQQLVYVSARQGFLATSNTYGMVVLQDDARGRFVINTENGRHIPRTPPETWRTGGRLSGRRAVRGGPIRRYEAARLQPSGD